MYIYIYMYLYLFFIHLRMFVCRCACVCVCVCLCSTDSHKAKQGTSQQTTPGPQGTAPGTFGDDLEAATDTEGRRGETWFVVSDST